MCLIRLKVNLGCELSLPIVHFGTKKKSNPICRFSNNYFYRISKRFHLRLSASISYLSLIILQVNGWMNYYIQFKDLIKNEKRRGWWRGKGVKWETRESKQGLRSKDGRKSRGSMESKKSNRLKLKRIKVTWSIAQETLY